MTAVIRAYASLFVLAAVIAAPSANAEEPAKRIALSGDRAYPESIAAAADGTIYVSSLASGGISRIKPGSATAEVWIAPGTYDTRSTFGVLVDDLASARRKVEGLGGDCFRHTPPPGHTGFYETKFHGPDGVVFDISEHPWPGLSAEDSVKVKVPAE